MLRRGLQDSRKEIFSHKEVEMTFVNANHIQPRHRTVRGQPSALEASGLRIF